MEAHPALPVTLRSARTAALVLASVSRQARASRVPAQRQCVNSAGYCVPRTLVEVLEAVVARGDQPAPGTLAAKLDHLFRTVYPHGRGPYSSEEVAAALREQAERDPGLPTVSDVYIWQLRNGRRDNPTKRHLEALARFFQVPVAYFFDDEASERIGRELDLLAAMRDARVRSVALRARDLSPDGLDAISAMVDMARRAEGLAAEPAVGGQGSPQPRGARARKAARTGSQTQPGPEHAP